MKMLLKVVHKFNLYYRGYQPLIHALCLFEKIWDSILV